MDADAYVTMTDAEFFERTFESIRDRMLEPTEFTTDAVDMVLPSGEKYSGKVVVRMGPMYSPATAVREAHKLAQQLVDVRRQTLDTLKRFELHEQPRPWSRLDDAIFGSPVFMSDLRARLLGNLS